MRLLIDENVPLSVATFFQRRGHEVIFVRDVLLPGTPDPVVAAIGDQMDAIVVTWNQKDFRELAARAPAGTRRRLRNLGRISFRCNETRGRGRIEQVIDYIEFEYEQCQTRSDPRLIMEIGESFIRIQR